MRVESGSQGDRDVKNHRRLLECTHGQGIARTVVQPSTASFSLSLSLSLSLSHTHTHTCTLSFSLLFALVVVPLFLFFLGFAVAVVVVLLLLRLKCSSSSSPLLLRPLFVFLPPLLQLLPSRSCAWLPDDHNSMSDQALRARVRACSGRLFVGESQMEGDSRP